MRAVAIVLVMLLHYSGPFRQRGDGLFSGGYLGVDIFFVLSGFLITSLLLGEQAKRGHVSFGAFYARRALRLFPALALLMVGHAIFVYFVGGRIATQLKMLAAVAFYVSNLAISAGFKELASSTFQVTWSLAIEEHFYLLWPALLLFGVLRFARTRAAVFGILAAAIVASVASRSFTWLHHHDYLAAYTRTDGRVDGLLIGAAAAFAWRWRLVPRRWLGAAASACLLALLVCGALAPRPNDVMFTVGFTAVSLAAAVVVLAIAEDEWSWIPLLAALPMRAVGRVSYGLYLWHVLGFRIAHQWLAFRHGRWTTVLLALTITAFAVTASWFMVEQPALRLKRRFERG